MTQIKRLPGWIKLNCDAALIDRPTDSSLGYALRDGPSALISAVECVASLDCNIEVAELHAMVVGLRRAADLGF